MPIEIIKTQYVSSGNKNKIPVTVEWKGERIIRGHSLQSSVREIVRMVQSLDVVKINIVGNQGTGKTTFAYALSHLIHKLSEKDFKVPFAVKHLSKTELINFEETIKKLEPTNWVLIFDDISFLNALVSKQRLEELKQKITEIRHLEGGQDVKIILVFIFHYTLGLQKYLRQSQFGYYSSIGSSEFDNMLNIVGNHYSKLLLKFQRICANALTKNKFTFNLGSKSKFFTYRYREPFIPLLFHNNDNLRIVVSPKREWIDPFCLTCTKSKDNTMKDGLSVKDFAEDLSYKFGKHIARNAVRIKLFQNGMNVYPKRVKQAMTYIERYSKDKLMNLQELSDYFKFYNDRTRLDEKIPMELQKQEVKS